jgi:hypothetical protein
MSHLHGRSGSEVRRKITIGRKPGHFSPVTHVRSAAPVIVPTPGWVHCHRVGRRDEIFKERVCARDAGIQDTDCRRVVSGGRHPLLQAIDQVTLLLGRRVYEECTAFLGLSNLREVVEYVQGGRELCGSSPREDDYAIVEPETSVTDFEPNLLSEL